MGLEKPKKLQLVPYESEILRRTLRPVPDPRDPEILDLAADMLYSIDVQRLKRGAAGMAANQWGFDWQMFVFCPEGNQENDPKEVVFNPSYQVLDEIEEEAFEGCFSIPRAVMRVRRPTQIQIRYQNADGEWIEKQLSDWAARVWQHETDHVLGVLCDAKGQDTLERIQFKDAEEQAAFYRKARGG